MKAYKIAALAVIALFLAATVSAEVVIDQKVTINTMGMEQKVTATSYFGADKSRTDMEMQGGYAAAMGGGKTVTIMRLDKGVIWTLMTGMKKYSETPLSAVAEMQKNPPAKADQGGLTWKTDLEKLGSSEINGFKCEGIKITAQGTDAKNPENNMTLTLEEWFASEYNGSDILDEFAKKASEAYGFNPLQQNEMLSAMSGQIGFDMADISAKLKEMKGFPIKMAVTTTKAGPAMDMSQMDEKSAAMMKKMMGDKAAGGQQVVFSMDMEITGIKTSSDVTPDYEIPEGYTKGM